MRIMIVNTYYYPEIIGGAEYSVKKLAEELIRKGNKVCVVCTGEKNNKEIINGVEVYRFKPHNICRAVNIDSRNKAIKFIRRIQDVWNISNRRILFQIISEFKPDVVNTNGLYDISPIVWKISNDLKIWTVHTIRDYYLMCPRVALQCDRNREYCSSIKPICKVYRKLNKYNSRLVNAVTAPSKLTLNKLLDDGYFSGSSIKVAIPNAIDFDKEEVSRIINYRNEKYRNALPIVKFVFIGSLTEQKGLHWLLKSFENINNAELIIAGKGPLKTEIESVAAQNPKINYVGFLPENGVNELLKNSDVLICPSLWEEPFGRVVLDAYKNAMPIIVSDRGALPELVKQNYSGIVVRAGDVSELREAIRFYCETKSNIAIHGINGAGLLHEYNLSTQADRFLKIYNRKDLQI